MKVIVPFELTETQLRQIRADFGRGGAATRKEAKQWMNTLVFGHLFKMPAPKVRQRTAPKVEQPRLEADDTVCSTCAHPKSEHGGFTAGLLRLSCPLSRSVKPGSTFRPAPDRELQALRRGDYRCIDCGVPLATFDGPETCDAHTAPSAPSTLATCQDCGGPYDRTQGSCMCHDNDCQ